MALLVLVGFGAPLAAQDSASPAVSPAAPATAPAIVVRQSVDPASGAVVGQHVAVYVDVLFPGAMPHPPRVSVPDVPGLQVFRFETQGVTISETIDGAAYAGQRFEFALYARRGGTFEVPPAVVTLLDRAGGDTGSAQGQAVRLEVTVPPGVDVSQPVVATHRLTLGEQWDPVPTGRFKAGDAVVRTLTRSAEDVPGLAMRDLAFPAPEGVRVYADPPDIQDRSNRGVVTGRRTDRVTYVFERGGSFALPAVTQPWWDLGARRLSNATAPAVTVKVEAGAAPAAAGRHSWTRRGLAWAGLGLVGLIGLALVAWQVDRRLRDRRADPERVAFAALRHACAGTDIPAIYRGFSLWAGQLAPERRRAANREAAALQTALFAAGPEAWGPEDSRRLLAGLDALRRQHPPAHAPAALPPLNPATPAA
ncbi:BatD family protein [Ancylobacter sonchi]|uniref:BatD family protein n=1 Tax=Ancylobacter sonchi TaxID=1937790 RepID=UPI001BD68487|nr:BatD family protein [Ancylobacter sonchi]MBS7535347.1 BatD family protein [Ancylobacter sonchi]